MLQPPCPEVIPPVLLDPVFDRSFTQVVPRLFAFDPLEPVGFANTFDVNTAPCYDRTRRTVFVAVELGRFHPFYT